MRRPSRRLTVGVAVATLAAAGAIAVVFTTSAAGGSPSPAAPPEAKTATVERRTLAEHESVDGTLGHGPATVVRAGRAGTLTRLPTEGTVLTRGQSLYELDGRPTAVLMDGDRPSWRPLGPGSRAGADIRQLKENLRSLGLYPRTGKLTGRWSARTTAAVKRWQRHQGHPATGRVELGDIVFLPTPVRVDTLKSAVGDVLSPGATAFEVTSAAQVIAIELPATHRAIVSVGDKVALDLPDGRTSMGRISVIGSVAHVAKDDQAPPGSSATKATVTVTVVPDDPDAVRLYDRAPVTVRIVSEEHKDVLSVPVTALVALKGGGYAVERVHADGSREYVPVEPGVFADGYVEVTSKATAADVAGAVIAPGDRVVVAE